MSDEYLLLVAILVFLLLTIGVVFTGIEFKRMEKEISSKNDKDKNF